jgi:hypothetical protein
MESLLEQLLEQWQNSFNELDTISDYKAQVKTTLYSYSSRYNLEKFDWSYFPSDGPLTKDKESVEGIGFHEYGFNDQGLPCYVAFRHDYNKVFWEGFYTYNDTLVRFVEFCVNTGVPSALIRMEFQEGRKVSFQRMAINGGASGYSLSQMSKEEIIGKIRNDGFSMISTVTRYHYDSTGKIKKASSIHISPGIGKFTSYDEYNYDKNQILETIRTFFEQGTNRITYCRIPENLSPDALVESLAEAMAALTVEAISNQRLTKPIALLELGYHYADNYIPLLAYQSAEDVAEKIARKESAFIPDYSDYLNVEIKPIENLLAQLEQMMDDQSNMDLGRRMLRKAAYILTRTKLSGKLNVTEDFAAYAIDWSIEGHSDAHFEEILIECGVEAGVMGKWKQEGILPE